MEGSEATYAVSPLLALELVLPEPDALDELAVLLLLPVERGDVVALDVGGDLEGGLGVTTTDKVDTADARSRMTLSARSPKTMIYIKDVRVVVVLAVDAHVTEDVLAAALKTGVETSHKVGGHEDHGELIVVLV